MRPESLGRPTARSSGIRCWFITLTCALLLGACAGPPASKDADRFSEQWEKARSVYREDGPSAALPLFETLLENYRGIGDRKREALTLAQIGNCQKHLGNYSQALDLLEQARAINIEIGDRAEEGWVNNSIGLVYWETADYERALSSLAGAGEVARESQDRELEATVLNNSALIHDELGDYDESRALYVQALDVFRERQDRHRENYVLGNLGGVLLLTGNFREAADSYRQALEISVELGSKPSEAIDRGNLGLCLLGMGSLEEAAQELDTALELSRETGQLKEQADWHHGKASLHLRTGDYPSALQEYLTALEVYSGAGLKRQQVEALSKLGELRMLLGDPSAAESAYQEGLALARSIGYRRGEMLQLIQLGDLQMRRREFAGALELYQQVERVAAEVGDRLQQTTALIRQADCLRKQERLSESVNFALQALQSVGKSGGIFSEAEARLSYSATLRDQGRFQDSLDALAPLLTSETVLQDPEVKWRLLHLHGHALEGLGHRQEALDAYSKAVDVLQNVRYQLWQAGLANAYLEDRYEPYLDVVRVSIRAGLNVEAFQAAIRLRLRSYLDLLERDPASSFARETQPELREKINHLRKAVEERKSAELDTPHDQALRHLIAELSEAQSAYEAGRQAQPGVPARVASALSPLEDIQRRLPPDAAVLEFVLSDDTLTLFVIRSSSLQTWSTDLDLNQLQIRVELLRSLLLQQQNPDWLRPSQRLYELLLGPVEERGWLSGVQRLFIVPHRILHYLPFAVLARPGEEKPRLLIEDYQIGYFLSSVQLFQDQNGSPSSSLLAMAPERARLQYHEEEVRSLAAGFPQPKSVLLGGAAKESALKERSGDFRVIHLATHSRFNRWNPMMSALELEPDAKDDGDLQVREILKLHLEADLVTLSACNTGLGSGQYSDLPAGDELLGLTQAFRAAGAAAVLASHWEVDDQSTSHLMQLFYSRSEELGPAEALARAQRQMWTEDHSHPKFWGGFALFGGIKK